MRIRLWGYHKRVLALKINHRGDVELAYIYFNGDRYIPMKDLGDDLADLQQDRCCFEVDELIAYPIAELNNKGYITEMSCAGHVLQTPFYEEFQDKEEREQLISQYDGKIFVEKKNIFDDENPDGEADCVGIIDYEQLEYNEAFIIFKDKVNSAPEGWNLQEGRYRIYTIIEPNDDLTVMYLENAKKMCNLMEWIKNLPSKKL